MRAYRLLLRLYPASFRGEYGEELRRLFERRRRDAAGWFARTQLWIETLAETIPNAVLVHADVLKQDLGYTIRVLRRTPGFALTAVLIIALGIGATTAAFSVTDFVLLRPLPFPEPHRLVMVWEREPAYTRMELSPANYRDWTRASHSFDRIGVYYSLSVNLTGHGEPLHLERTAVSSDLFRALGVTPLAGRLFSDDDDREGAPATVILSYRLWQTMFGGADSAVGQHVLLDNEPCTIIGVMPREFRFPTSETALWQPMRLAEDAYQDRNDNIFESVGRLKPGVTIDQVRAEWNVLAAQSTQQYPRENEHTTVSIFPLADEVSRQSRLLVEALFGAAACVLLIACANLANLLLARALGRRRELAVRTALGAGRERLVRQLMTESLLLAVLGGAIGVAVAAAAVPLLARLVPSTLPIAESPAVDLRVLLFAGALTVLTGVVFGLAPVLRVGADAGLGGLREGSRAGGGRKERLRSALVVTEITASIVLLVSAGLLMRALWTIQSTDPGFKASGVLTLRTALPMPQYAAVASRESFYTRVLSDVRALPGVSRAAYVTAVPLVFRGGIWPVSLDGKQVTRADNQNAILRYVTPDFFATLGIPLRRGRDVSESDGARRLNAAVVSDSFVQRYWPNQDPIGRHFDFALSDRTVVGIVGDIRARGLERTSEPQVYLPYRQVDDRLILGYLPKDLVIRTAASPTAIVPAVRAIIRNIDPKQPVSDVRSLSDIVDLETVSRAAQVSVIGAFAVIAFVLAAIGIHGLLSFTVSQRAQEIGVRLALGAQASDIFNMVVRRGLALALAGVIPGVALAYAAGRAMQALLVGVTPADAPTFLAVVALAAVMTIAGTLLPTLRALKVDPITAMRVE